MILDTIVDWKRQEVDSLKHHGISTPDCQIDPPRGFQKALTGYDGLSVIAEAKKASPSKGVICPDFNPVKILPEGQGIKFLDCRIVLRSDVSDK